MNKADASFKRTLLQSPKGVRLRKSWLYFTANLFTTNVETFEFQTDQKFSMRG